MKKWSFLLALVVVAAGLVVYATPHTSSAAQDCKKWGNATADRVATARQLLYPKERQEQSTGSVQGDAQALYKLAQDQANTQPPDQAVNLNGDLIEAFSAGANALSGGASSDAQIAFAKAIVYNADLRVSYLLDGC